METIVSAREIDELFKRGTRVADPALVVLSARTPEHRSGGGRVLFVAGKKLGGAVMRNRCKRVLRASCHRCGGPWPGYDVALMARAATPSLPAEKLDEAVLRAIKRAGVSP